MATVLLIFVVIYSYEEVLLLTLTYLVSVLKQRPLEFTFFHYAIVA